MRVAHLLVCHSVSPMKLFNSLPETEDDLWIVFLHSESIEVANVVRNEMSRRGGLVFDFRENRGLAKSWNDGIRIAMYAGCDIVMLLNDDLFFYEGGYVKFRLAASQVPSATSDVFMITMLGLESGNSPFAGEVHVQSFSCCMLTKKAIETVGYFDESFVPAYYEDCDYMRRAILAGMTHHVDERILVEHERGSTSRQISFDSRSLWEQVQAENLAHFKLKWGGSPSDATFLHPFNRPELGWKIRFEHRFLPYGLDFQRKIRDA